MFEIEELADKVARGDGSIRDYIVITRKMSRVCRKYAAKYAVVYSKTYTAMILCISEAAFKCTMGIITVDTDYSMLANGADTPEHNYMVKLEYDGVNLHCTDAPVMTAAVHGTITFHWSITAAECILIARMFKMCCREIFETVDDPHDVVTIDNISKKLLVGGKTRPYHVYTTYRNDRPFLYLRPHDDIYSAASDIGSFKNFRRVRRVEFTVEKPTHMYDTGRYTLASPQMIYGSVVPALRAPPRLGKRIIQSPNKRTAPPIDTDVPILGIPELRACVIHSGGINHVLRVICKLRVCCRAFAAELTAVVNYGDRNTYMLGGISAFSARDETERRVLARVEYPAGGIISCNRRYSHNSVIAVCEFKNYQLSGITVDDYSAIIRTFGLLRPERLLVYDGIPTISVNVTNSGEYLHISRIFCMPALVDHEAMLTMFFGDLKNTESVLYLYGGEIYSCDRDIGTYVNLPRLRVAA